MAHSKRRRLSPLRHELDDLVRGVCGGFLFGVPLLYTVEVWWIGSSVSPAHLLAVLLTTLLVCYLFSRTAGFRKAQALRERVAVGDAIEAIAIGLVCAAVMLIILRQITFETRFSEALGKVIFESVPFSLGVSLANQFLQSSDDQGSDSQNSDNQNSDGQNSGGSQTSQPEQASLSSRTEPKGNLNETVTDIGATLVGAIIIAFSIAPTDEVSMLVAAVDGPWLLIMVIVSLVLSYGIVFQADFIRQGQRRSQQGLFQGPISETAFAYLISLLAAALMLGFFRKIDLGGPLELAFRQVLILGLPATIGGAAGRLAI
ncbi:MAG: TIGR02587 family membrane protein [Phormidesmis sp.]